MSDFLEGMHFVKTGDGSYTLYLGSLNETYHSRFGAVTESLHVFIRMGLEERYAVDRSSVLYVGEMGFGTGLNALLTLRWAHQNKVKIIYETFDKFPLDFSVIENLNYTEKGSGFDSFFVEMHKAPWNKEAELTPFFTLHKHQMDFRDIDVENAWDVIYFDAFGPDKQPGLWDIHMMKKMYLAMRNGGIFVTYSAKGEVRRNLLKAGFEVEKLPGPPGKREMLRARKRILPSCQE